jgi:hypothetical protein
MRRAVLAFLAATGSAIAVSVGCGGADEHPLGGPYGGAVNGVGPTNGTNAGGDSGASQADDGGSSPDPGMDASAPPPGVDASPPPPGVDASPPPHTDSGPPPAAPTWSSIYSKYFASGTIGHCSSCHSQSSSASSLYTWMKGKGYINGTGSTIVSSSSSDISWFGGSMPPQGPSSEPAAALDMKAWVAAGAANN